MKRAASPPLPTAPAATRAVAMRTATIRIGTFIIILPYQHPLLIAEEVANVDILSNGRFDLGVGQGYSHYEFDALCMNRSERGMRTRESIRIIERLFTEDAVIAHTQEFLTTYETFPLRSIASAH